MPMIDEVLAGYVVYRATPSDKGGKGDKLFLIWGKVEGKPFGFQMHDNLDEAEEQVFLDMGNEKEEDFQKGDYVIQAVFWEGKTLYIPNSIPREVK